MYARLLGGQMYFLPHPPFRRTHCARELLAFLSGIIFLIGQRCLQLASGSTLSNGYAWSDLALETPHSKFLNGPTYYRRISCPNRLRPVTALSHRTMWRWFHGKQRNRFYEPALLVWRSNVIQPLVNYLSFVFLPSLADQWIFLSGSRAGDLYFSFGWRQPFSRGRKLHSAIAATYLRSIAELLRCLM